MEGFIKIFRKLQGWEWYKDSETVHLFIHLILKANFKPSRFMGYDIPRGSLVCGRKTLSLSTGISEQSIRTILERLKSTSEITSKSTNKFSIITICNYETYQILKDDFNQQKRQQLTNDQPTTNQQLTTSEEVKNVKNVKNVIPPTLEMVKNYTIKHAPNIDPQHFIDHYDANGWMIGKSKMKNWQAAIRTWNRNNFNNQNNLKQGEQYERLN